MKYTHCMRAWLSDYERLLEDDEIVMSHELIVLGKRGFEVLTVANKEIMVPSRHRGKYSGRYEEGSGWYCVLVTVSR